MCALPCYPGGATPRNPPLTGGSRSPRTPPGPPRGTPLGGDEPPWTSRAEQRGVLLQRPHAHLAADDGLDPLHGGGQACRRGDTRDAAADRGRADLLAVKSRPALPPAPPRPLHH